MNYPVRDPRNIDSRERGRSDITELFPSLLPVSTRRQKNVESLIPPATVPERPGKISITTSTEAAANRVKRRGARRRRWGRGWGRRGGGALFDIFLGVRIIVGRRCEIVSLRPGPWATQPSPLHRTTQTIYFPDKRHTSFHQLMSSNNFPITSPLLRSVS